ncbi:low affinity immunoglobulin gamma Fc region receptor II-like [Poecilia latipinna]|uniref:low affinity immunoglobulin gamma Fc region receptor II-like n=1 Tax=Poecilia latipinna TaxID=48699 RepID=UPI00072E1618|nr:PREDICTED: low affinity immunoglobulin gamma Fc region receptor II-like [Poecilia latipinna]
MKQTSARLLLFLTLELFCTPSRAVRLTVSPSRSQFFQGESVTLICEDGNSSDGGTVRRNTTRGASTWCGNGWGRKDGSTCSISFVYALDTGLYWCESMSGSSSSSSSSIQLSVSGGSVILQSPVLPVMEGDDVTLRCHDKTFSKLPAAFYKDGSFIGDGPTGNLTLNPVKRSDEGLYHCNISGQGESPSSRISVEGRITSISPPPSSTSTPDLQNLHNNIHCLIFFSAAVSLLYLVLLV